MDHPSPTTGPVVGDSRRAVHHALLCAAAFSALVGAYRHHHGDDAEVPAALAAADQHAFDEAATLCELAAEPDGPVYDLVAVTAHAFASGRAHADGDCVFCDTTAEPDELVVAALADARALAAVAV